MVHKLAGLSSKKRRSPSWPPSSGCIRLWQLRMVSTFLRIITTSSFCSILWPLFRAYLRHRCVRSLVGLSALVHTITCASTSGALKICGLNSRVAGLHQTRLAVCAKFRSYLPRQGLNSLGPSCLKLSLLVKALGRSSCQFGFICYLLEYFCPFGLDFCCVQWFAPLRVHHCPYRSL